MNSETYNATCSFYLVRIVSQPPCVVLHLAFIGGTSSCRRNQIINELNCKLKQCKFPQRNLSSSLVQSLASAATAAIPATPKNAEPEPTSPASEETGDSSQPTEASKTNEVHSKSEDEAAQVTFKVGDDTTTTSTTTSTSTTTISSNSNNSSERRMRNLSGNKHCFILLDRPIERMLVRYERVPRDFFNCYKYEEDLRRQASGATSHVSSLCMFQTLTRYLCHKRFIWYTHSPPHTMRLTVSAVSKILSVLTM